MPLKRWSAIAGLILGAVVLAAAALTLIFGDAILNGYGKRKMERAFAKALPRYSLRVGTLDYLVGDNRLVAQWVTLRAKDMTLKTGRVSLTGVRWTRLLWGKTDPIDLLAVAILEAENLEMEIPRWRHGIRCARLRASVPDSELTAERIALRPLLDDEEFFAANEFRKIRFRAIVPECRVSGLEFGELFGKQALRARAIDCSRLSVDALANRDKPVKPVKKPPLSVTEALVALRLPLKITRLRITDGDLRYGEQASPGSVPGVWTVTSVNIAVENIANRGDASAVILLRGQGLLMDAAECKVLMTIPVASPDYSLHYSGSIGAMDLVRLNAFLEHAKHFRIKSGKLQVGAFDIDVTDGLARGRVEATYDDLKIALLNKQTDSAKGWGDRAVSFSVNAFKIRNSNAPHGSASMKVGTVSYPKDPQERFLKFTWHALRTGIRDVISH